MLLLLYSISLICALHSALCLGSDPATQSTTTHVEASSEIQEFLNKNAEIQPYIVHNDERRGLIQELLIEAESSLEKDKSLIKDPLKEQRAVLNPQAITTSLIEAPHIQANSGRLLIKALQNGELQRPLLFIINPSTSADSSLHKHPAGLKNPKNKTANRCYLNAALQLFNTAYQDLNQAFMQKKPDANSIIGKFSEVLHETQAKGEEEVLGYLSNKGAFLDFSKKVNSEIFKLEETSQLQQDSNEFFAIFNPHLFEAYPSLDKLLRTTAAAYDTYEGKVLNVRPDPAIALLLDLDKNSGSHALEDLLENRFAKQETIDNYEYDKPDGTGKISVTATTQERLTHVGPYVMINLKRNVPDTTKAINTVEGHGHGHETVKNLNPTPFPLVGLDLNKYFEDQHANVSPYELLGIIMHQGSAKSGHYIAYVRGMSAGKPQWFLCDDKEVTPQSDLAMTRIAYRGYGETESFVPTTFLYKCIDEKAQAAPLSGVDEAVFLLAYTKNGACEVITKKQKGSSASAIELAQSLETLLKEKTPLPTTTQEGSQALRSTHTKQSSNKKRVCSWIDTKAMVITLAIAFIVVGLLVYNKKKVVEWLNSHKKKGSTSTEDQSNAPDKQNADKTNQ